jgi:hypothetical protein
MEREDAMSTTVVGDALAGVRPAAPADGGIHRRSGHLAWSDALNAYVPVGSGGGR